MLTAHEMTRQLRAKRWWRGASHALAVLRFGQTISQSVGDFFWESGGSWARKVAPVAIFGHLVAVVDKGDSSAVFRVIWLRTQGGALNFRFCRGTKGGIGREACRKKTSFSGLFVRPRNFDEKLICSHLCVACLQVGVEYQEPPRSLCTILCG